MSFRGLISGISSAKDNIPIMASRAWNGLKPKISNAFGDIATIVNDAWLRNRPRSSNSTSAIWTDSMNNMRNRVKEERDKLGRAYDADEDDDVLLTNKPGKTRESPSGNDFSDDEDIALDSRSIPQKIFNFFLRARHTLGSALTLDNIKWLGSKVKKPTLAAIGIAALAGIIYAIYRLYNSRDKSGNIPNEAMQQAKADLLREMQQVAPKYYARNPSDVESRIDRAIAVDPRDSVANIAALREYLGSMEKTGNGFGRGFCGTSLLRSDWSCSRGGGIMRI